MVRPEYYSAALCLISFIIFTSTVSAAFVPPPRAKNRSSSSPSTPFISASVTALPTISNSSVPIPEKAVKNKITCTCVTVTNDSVETKLKDDHNASLPVSNERIKKTVQKGILRFSLKFQNILSNSTDKSKNNVIFAPINILAGLATLLLGSEAESKEEILNLLEFYAGKDLSEKYPDLTIHSILGDLFANFTAEGEHNPAVKTKMNQGIFYQADTELKEEFVKHAKGFYNNELIAQNFSSGDDAAAKAINDWVSYHTEKRIKEIVKPPLSVDTKLILLNTLFFNGEWDEPFFANSTMSDFHLEKGGPPVKVKTMSNSGMIYYYYNATHYYSVIGLPYKGGETVMYIILPDKGQKLGHVLHTINSHDLFTIMNSTERDTDASYTLPYMHLSDNVGLRKMLENLGVHNIFDPIKANLTKIAENVGLYVSEALHNVNLDVTEAGSTGAASTAVIIETKFPSKKILLVNRPFSFYIIHRPSGVISFWGTIYDPRSRI